MTALRFYSGKHFACWVYRDHIHTMLRDGSETRGYPLDDQAFLNSARYLGYGDDTYWHMIEHDLAHNWATDYLGIGHSIALWNQGHDQDAWLKPCPPDAQAEEDLVSALQSALNGQEWGKGRINELLEDRAKDMLQAAQMVFRPNGETMTTTWAQNENRSRSHCADG